MLAEPSARTFVVSSKKVHKELMQKSLRWVAGGLEAPVECSSSSESPELDKRVALVAWNSTAVEFGGFRAVARRAGPYSAARRTRRGQKHLLSHVAHEPQGYRHTVTESYVHRVR